MTIKITASKPGPPHSEAEEPSEPVSVPTSQAPPATEGDKRSSGTVFSWLPQGIEKVLPQPTRSQTTGKEGISTEGSSDTSMPELTKAKSEEVKKETKPEIKVELTSAVQDLPPAPATDPGSGSHTSVHSKPLSPAPPLSPGKSVSVIEWLKYGLEKVVPHPGDMPQQATEEGSPPQQQKEEGQLEEPVTKTDGKKGTTAEEEPKPQLDLLAKSSSSTLGGSVFGWFVQNLEKVIPHPLVTKTCDGIQVEDTEAECIVQEGGKMISTLETKGK
ncbi:cyclic nucleotide-gated cation channel beta-1-like [Protopterus annectens]|uniref:cyclic nucleotide-gated cation channel beta-1-like n=1 Tax=Protopterus annectens TaxID=7888 RepID=UPI001CFA5ED2|nr:cyclic nucleotide-gated cation channel beta-1-like [Protopterus annectens]